MSQVPLPPGFEAMVAERRARRRRRRIIAATLGALLVVGAVAGTWRFTQGTSAGSGGGAAPSSTAAAAAGTTCDGPATELVVAADIAPPTMAQLAGDFSASGADVNGRCVNVNVASVDTTAAMQIMINGIGLRPDVWVPSASSWLAVLADRLQQANHPALVDPTAEFPHLASSPIVAAMPRPMAAAMGWPDAPIGWSDIRALALDPDGWGRFGHPEWGQFTLGTSTPLVAPPGLRARVSDAGTWATADAYGKTLSFLSGLITDENRVADYNQTKYNQTNPTVPLVAIYPKDGSVVSDYPYVTLSGDWMTPEKKAAAAAFGDYLRSPAAVAAFRAAHYRDADGVLAATTTGTDPRPASELGLNPAQPTKVLEQPGPKQSEALLTRWAWLDVPLTALNLVDVSGSMAGQIDRAGGSTSKITKIQAATEVLTAAVARYPDTDDVGLWSFSGGQGLADYTERVPIGPMDAAANGIPRRTALTEALGALRARGRTSLYNTLAAGYSAVAASAGQAPADQPRRPLVVLVTDGQNDIAGGLPLDELLAQITAAPAPQRIPVMTIAFGSGADRANLAAIAKASGGAAFVAATQDDLAVAYAEALTTY